MGWGLERSKRQAVLRDCYVAAAAAPHQEEQTTRCIVDMNAKIRQKAVDTKAGAHAVSMWNVVANVFKEVNKAKPQHITCIFDAPDHMPSIRTILWASRYRRAAHPDTATAKEFANAAATATTAAKCSNKAVKPPYAALFAPGSDAKRQTWLAFCNITKRIAARTAATAGITIVVVDQKNIETTFKDGTVSVAEAQFKYGEADLKAYAQAAKAAASPHANVIIYSVDTDLILQAVATVAVPP